MSEYNNNNYQEAYTSQAGSLRSYINKVFMHMAGGLGVTTAVAVLGYLSLYSGGLVYNLFTSSPIFTIVLVVAQLGIAIALGTGLTRFSTATCSILFYVYSAITGLTFSVLPLEFGVTTVFTAFLFAAVMFVCCAIIGHTTTVDLTKFSGLLMGGLIALVLTTVISMFVPALRNSLVISYIGILLFLVLTAYDMQRIKQFYYSVGEGTIKSNLAIYSAFQLYLDFINLFLRVLRILAARNSRN